MPTNLKRKSRDDFEAPPLKRARALSDESHTSSSDMRSSSSTAATGPSSRLARLTRAHPTFLFLTEEQQVYIFEKALAQLDKPRIVQIDATTAPCFDHADPARGVTLGWELAVTNRDELQAANPRELACEMLRFSPAGARAGARYLGTRGGGGGGGPAWDPPRYCPGLGDLDLSLASDVFRLPNDVYDLVTVRARHPPACREFGGDEDRVRRVMIDIETLIREVSWARGDAGPFQIAELERGGEEGEEHHCSPLRTTLGYFPACEEIIVLVGFSGVSSSCTHLSWDQLLYVRADEAYGYLSDSDDEEGEEWECAESWRGRCMHLWDLYYTFVGRTGESWPKLSFAFLKTAT